MSHHLVRNKDFAGKTIKYIDARAVNFVRFFFTDGTALAIEVESVGPGLTGMVVCSECATLDDEVDPKCFNCEALLPDCVCDGESE